MKNVLKTAGNRIALTTALAAVLLVSSCKKEAQITPASSANVAGASKTIAKSNYKVSQPITLTGAHDMTISGDSISGGANSCISLINCYNIHITNCKLVNSSAMGVSLSACSNIIVDDCKVTNVATGVYSFNGKSISVMNNKMNAISGGATVAFENLGDDAKDAASNSAINNELAQ